MLESRHKGVLITNLGAITAMNVHLNPNMDGNWSKENRFYPLHKLQLEALNDLVNQSQFENSIIIMSGDFNLAKDCDLFPEFLKQGYWDDAFAGDLTPTFRAEFLKAGRIAHCIDYVLVRGPKHKVQVKEVSYRFADKVELANGTTAFISDHKGLYAKLSL
jgi:hypothetical protein